MPTTLSDSQPKARKAHRCSWCGDYILPGEKYNRASLVDGGDFWCWKSHISCDKLFHALDKLKYLDGYYPEELTSDAFQDAVQRWAEDNGIDDVAFSGLVGQVKRELLRELDQRKDGE